MYRSHVLVCGGTECTSSGSPKIMEALKYEIKHQGLEEEVAVVETGCHGLDVYKRQIQIRQAPISLISFKKHRVGISICASLAASRIVEPLGAVTAMPVSYTHLDVYKRQP